MTARATPASFWARVLKRDGDCWLWIGRLGVGGYGRVDWRGSRIVAHRVAWELRFGPIPAGMKVLHVCDHPACVNPSHLFLGTQADNVADMKAKGRGNPRHGELNSRPKLTWKAVEEIRSRYVPRRVPISLLAREYGVSTSAVFDVLSGRTWNVVRMIEDDLDLHGGAK